MNRQTFWLIIGLMALALLGLGGLQWYWISSALRLNEEEFDNRVIAALNEVARRLEYDEQLEAFNYLQNGYSRSFIENEVRQKIESGRLGNLSFTLRVEHYSTPSIAIDKDQLLDFLLDENACQCPECQAERQRHFASLITYFKGLDLTPIVERIKLPNLDRYLRQELEDRGIDTEFKYGVYSNRKRSFVIADGHYVVEDPTTQPTRQGYKNLYTSPYRVSLFQKDGTPPGLLMVYFPNRSSFVWSSVWLVLLTTILFILLIIGTFGWTMYTLVRQKKLSEMKNDFINNMTHEFKTPIATISLAADSITSPMVLTDTAKVRRFADIIKQENQRMNEQVERVLQMAKIDRRDFNLKIEPVDMHDVIDSAVHNISLQVARREGTIDMQLQADQAVIDGDRTHLTNVIYNLLDNANKYSPEKPQIVVRTRNANGQLEVMVQDHGIGMSKEARKHIFDKFYRVHTGNVHDVKGFGLGLSYVKAMVDAHHGTISVKSEPGKGSTFILRFPLRPA